MKSVYVSGLAVCILIGMGCANDIARSDISSRDTPLVTRIEEGIERLNAGIDGLGRIAFLQDNPTDVAEFREIEALDLAAWQLRRQQWALQRNRLERARDLLRTAMQATGDTGLAAQWTTQDREYVQQLEKLHLKRNDIERQRLQVEGRLIERHLR